MSFRETAKFQQGHTAELRIARMLQARGWWVVPSYDYSGEDGNKAPRLQGATQAFVLPDLDVARDGIRRWAEVKSKSSATLTRKLGRYEHGIPLRHFRSYQEVQRITGAETWLFIYELDSHAVLWARVDDLAKHCRIYEGDKMGGGPMVFFPRDSFAASTEAAWEWHPTAAMPIATQPPIIPVQISLWAAETS